MAKLVWGALLLPIKGNKIFTEISWVNKKIDQLQKKSFHTFHYEDKGAVQVPDMEENVLKNTFQWKKLIRHIELNNT